MCRVAILDTIQAKHSSCIKPLLELLHQPIVKPEIFTIRELAIKVLGELGDARAVEPLSQLTFDENNQVREVAKRALRKIGQKN
ncbi:hypothetical protein WA1_49390 [Scytonema hofmannii PCC 7110]|uniref:HEAT repeat domain-containing protein n=1 Tax=Scytonema hofmannii PCC 7110 TaxID=128403 RepID=A0A139WQP8_9CYAN|nr:HEAT repeat domain-containing protein [Scytonema hofmannii]KYC34754.1 hypothetical protein WA1_49390 [Scytonema hofmannii PCC 7110]